MFLTTQPEILIENYALKLQIVAALSGLFSENDIPYVHYRLAENLFCSVFSAVNHSRSDTMADASINALGFWIKTFGTKRFSSTEKIAEFDKKSPDLKLLEKSPLKLANRLAELKNERMQFALNIHEINKIIYHLVVRQENCVLLLEQPMDFINAENICIIKSSKSSLIFEDGIHEYNFNFSKSTLMQKFYIENLIKKIPVTIHENPVDLLLRLKDELIIEGETHMKNAEDFVILPLYSIRSDTKYVPAKSGLNQWNAGGRERHSREVYIPIPRVVHDIRPNFFPNRNTDFELILPNNKSLTAKVCQENDKALMSNPNKDLGEWLLDQVLNVATGELVTYKMLHDLGIDSVMVRKLGFRKYEIDFKKIGTYEEFINGEYHEEE